MINRRQFSAVASALAAAPVVQTWAAAYPARLIRLIVPFPAGAAVDTIARMFAESMAIKLNANIYVDNKVGANGTIGSADVARADADGYTLLFNSTTLVQAPLVMPAPSYDPRRDFTAIGGLGTTPQPLVINAATPAKTLEEFVRLSRGKESSFGTYGPGTTPHAFLQLFSNLNKLDMVHVPYKGEGAMVIDLIGGRLQCGMGTMTTMAPQIQAGKLRALACLSDSRIPSLPDVPTFVELGYPKEFSWSGFIGLFAPKNLPASIAELLADTFADTMKQPRIRSKLRDLDIVVQETRLRETQTIVDSSYASWAKIVKDLRLAETS